MAETTVPSTQAVPANVTAFNLRVAELIRATTSEDLVDVLSNSRSMISPRNNQNNHNYSG